MGEYDVELEVPGRLRWGDDVGLCEGTPVGLRQLDGTCEIEGRVVEFDSAGVLSLEFDGATVMVELANCPCVGVLAGASVSVCARGLEIYPSAP